MIVFSSNFIVPNVSTKIFTECSYNGLTMSFQIQLPLQQVSQQFAVQSARQLANHSNLQAILSQAPNVLTQPLGYTIDNLRPFDVPAYVNLHSNAVLLLR